MVWPKLVALSAEYCTTQQHTPLVPYSAHDPPVSLPYASDSARSPEGKSGTRQGRRCFETATCLTYGLHSSAALHVGALTCTRLAAFQPYCARRQETYLSFKHFRGLFVTHCTTAALGGDTKQRCVVRCRQLPNQALRGSSVKLPLLALVYSHDGSELLLPPAHHWRYRQCEIAKGSFSNHLPSPI
jgi:hypothetical protein